MASNPPTRSRIPPPSGSTLRKPTSSSQLRVTATSSTTTPVRPRVVGTPASRLNASTSSATGNPSRTLHAAKSSSSLSAQSVTSSSRTSPSKSTIRPTASSSARTKPPLKSPLKSPPPELPPVSPTKPTLSLKEQIALRRAEAKKLAKKVSTPSLADGDGLPEDDEWNGGRGQLGATEEEDILGRKTIKETIERARETGNLNLSSRTLDYLPTSLFTIHLGIDPEPLPNQAPPATEAEENKPSRHLAYYEVIDLTSLKARDNAISALQPELSLFGSLKVLDFAKNLLEKIPDTIGELLCLVHLDLSENKLEEFPECLASLPLLAWLDLSKNSLKQLRVAHPPPSADFGTDSFFSPSSHSKVRGILPALKSLNLADNQLSATTINSTEFPPKGLVKLDLSGNPLGQASSLIELLGTSQTLKDLLLRKTELEEGTLVVPAHADGKSTFKNLQHLDIMENGWVQESEINAYFQAIGRPITLVNAGAAPGVTKSPGVIEILVGVKDTREAWEIEADERGGLRSPVKGQTNGDTPAAEETGLAIGENSGPPVFGGGRKRQDPPKVVEKEQWEQEVEEDLHTEAARLRKRMEEAKIAEEKEAQEEAARREKEPPKATLEKYYEEKALTITLPASKRVAHNRHASLVLSRGSGVPGTDPNVPTETLPFSVIASQPWSSTLRALHLSNRRADTAFVLGAASDTVRLDKVEELLLDGCGLSDLVRVKRPTEDGKVGETKEATLEILGSMFPAMATLDLSENGLAHISGLVKLFFPEGPQAHGRGLKVLRLKGNSITNVAGLVEVAERFGRGESDGWRGEEIDIRDNQIPKLPPVLGLLQLDVLLVEGNAFRVPPRTVWLKEGTQGLLKYLRESAG